MPTASLAPSPSPTPTASATPVSVPSLTPTDTLTPSPSSTPTATPTLLDTQGDILFSDGFESGDLSAWSAASDNGGLLNASPQAALTGAFGIQATINSATSMYVQDDTPASESSYHARFYFNPNGLLPNGAANSGFVTIFSGLNATTSTVFQVQFRRLIAGGGTYQVRLGILRAGGNTFTTPVMISNAAHAIEIAWQSGTSASASLYVDGVLQQTLTGLDTSAFILESIRFGPSAGLVAASTGTLYFDAFNSTRATYIGP